MFAAFPISQTPGMETQVPLSDGALQKHPAEANGHRVGQCVAILYPLHNPSVDLFMNSGGTKEIRQRNFQELPGLPMGRPQR